MQDETTGTEQGTPSGKAGQSSGGKGGTTSKDKGKLYKEAEIVKIKSDAAAEAGRLRKAAEVERDTFKGQLETTKSRLDKIEREVDESRIAEAGDDTDKLRGYRRDQAISRRERDAEEKDRDITRREEQLKTDREEVAADKSVVSVAYLAAKHGLEPGRLEKLGIKDPETLEKVAEEIAAADKAKPKGEGADAERQAYEALETDAEKEAFIAEHPDFDKEAAEFVPDSGDTTGGAVPLTVESVEKMPMQALEKAIEKTEEKTK